MHHFLAKHTGAAEGTFSNATSTGGGVYTATFTGTTPGAGTLTATVNGTALTSALPSIAVTPGPVSTTQSKVAIAPASVAAGGTALVTLVAEDAYGNHQTSGGLTVTFALGNGVGSGTFGPVVDHGDGTYTAAFIGATVGVNTVTATINTLAVTSAAPSITVTPGR